MAEKTRDEIKATMVAGEVIKAEDISDFADSVLFNEEIGGFMAEIEIPLFKNDVTFFFRMANSPNDLNIDVVIIFTYFSRQKVEFKTVDDFWNKIPAGFINATGCYALNDNTGNKAIVSMLKVGDGIILGIKENGTAQTKTAITNVSFENQITDLSTRIYAPVGAYGVPAP
ncbi:hypothetical protein [Pseudolactococcus insecticola]|uniref:Uncharacterized protein n=1 Tax=Pseudolactococcus insecticola TaxID=2709158 RepID=A0A6A0B473_9LACT|nr:hypothetical protein [Lactococcus insecticola]GFH39846.1 hypothetical protein Hs20B_02440 [Lactococcus insecticola]